MPIYIFKFCVIAYFNLGNTGSMISRQINIFFPKKQMIFGNIKITLMKVYNC